MIRKALTEMCHISENNEVNSENYMFALDYIDNLFHITSILKKHMTVKQVTFLPSFKSQYICDEYKIPYSLEEAEMKVIRFQSDLFLVNKELELKIRTDLNESGYCTATEFDKNMGIITVCLK